MPNRRSKLNSLKKLIGVPPTLSGTGRLADTRRFGFAAWMCGAAGEGEAASVGWAAERAGLGSAWPSLSAKAVRIATGEANRRSARTPRRTTRQDIRTP